MRTIVEHWVVNREWWREPDPVAAQPELEFWRVEAGPVRSPSVGVYELRQDVAAGAWMLLRVAD